MLTQIPQHLQSFSGRPSVLVSAKYTRVTKPDDAMWVWLENEFRRFRGLCQRILTI